MGLATAREVRADVVVIGGGVVGLATAREVRAGCSALSCARLHFSTVYVIPREANRARTHCVVNTPVLGTM